MRTTFSPFGARFRYITILAAVAATAAVFAVTAGATTTPYWGYNNLTSSNPPAGTCPGAVAGIACDGFNYWDYSEAGWNSGRSSWALGFICQSDGLLWGHLYSGSETFTTYDQLWSTFCPTHYNRTAVAHVNGGSESYNYLQARSVIYP